jgi:hypothetical protein
MPAASRKKPDVSNPCVEYCAMLGPWELLADTFAGSEAVRQNAAVYLPQHEAEPATAYRERVENALVYDFMRQTVSELTGRAFSRPPQWGELKPESKWTPFLSNADMRGQDATNFARSWFSRSMLFGLSWVYVDTSADRPTWKLLDPRDVFFVAIDEAGKITEGRFRREIVTISGFEEIISEEIVRITLDKVETWRMVSKKWERHSTAKNSSGVVPLIAFVPEPGQGIIHCAPPLLDLAELTLTHARRLSDLETTLKVASFPILALTTTDGTETSSFAIGPHTMISLEIDGDAKYVEHSGAAIGVMQASLRDLEERAASFGVRLLKRRRPSVETATAASIAGQEASAPLQNHVFAFGEAFRTLIALTAKLWPAGGEAPTVQFSTDFLPTEGDATTLISLRQLGDLSRQDMLMEMKRRGVLSQQFNVADNDDRLSTEAPLLLTARGSNHGQ